MSYVPLDEADTYASITRRPNTWWKLNCTKEQVAIPSKFSCEVYARMVTVMIYKRVAVSSACFAKHTNCGIMINC